MQVHCDKLIEEIEGITTVDGFVAACLEIKESMFFYDRHLMLAAYSASLELVAAAALFSAALKSSAKLQWAEEKITKCLSGLFEELEEYQLPLDIRHIAEHYLQETGFNTSLRMPVYLEMIRSYTNQDTPGEIGELLRKAHLSIYQHGLTGEADLNRLLGQVGALMLQGAHLRPFWLQISHSRLYVILIGLQTLMNNFRVTPYFTFPLENITTERQKRKKIRGNVVLDLGVFRNLRQGGPGYTELNVSISKDEYDYFLEQLFSNPEFLDIKPDERIITLISAVLEARLINPEIEGNLILKALIYCDFWGISQVSDTLLQLLTVLEPNEALFQGCKALLWGFDTKALPAVCSFVRANRKSPFLVELADFLSAGKPGKRKWSLLREMFEHYPGEDEIKVQMAVYIARRADAQAVACLEEALAKGSRKDYRLGLTKALKLAKDRS